MMERGNGYWNAQDARFVAAQTAQIGAVSMVRREGACGCPCGCREYTCADRCTSCTYGSFGRHDAVLESDWEGDLALALATRARGGLRAGG